MGKQTIEEYRGHLYDTLAGKMAREMAAKSGSTEWIDKDVWNIFIDRINEENETQIGKKIREKISIIDAMNSITTYCVKKAAWDPNCENGTAKAREWYNDPAFGDCFTHGNTSSTSNAGAANNSGNASGAQQNGGTAQQNQGAQQNQSAQQNGSAQQNQGTQQNQGAQQNGSAQQNGAAQQNGVSQQDGTQLPAQPADTALVNNNGLPAQTVDENEEQNGERLSWSERVERWWGKTAGHDIVSGDADDGELTGGDIAKSLVRGVPKLGVEMAAHPVESVAGIAGTVAVSALVGKAAVAMGIAASAGPVGWIAGAVIGLAFAGVMIYQGVKANKEAKEMGKNGIAGADAKAKQGYEDIGSGAFTAIMSAFGLRKGVKGVKANSPAAKATAELNKPIEQPKVVELKGTTSEARTTLADGSIEEVKTVGDKPVSKSSYKQIESPGKISRQDITTEKYSYDAKGNKVQTTKTEYAFGEDGKPVVGKDGKQVVKSQTVRNVKPGTDEPISEQTFKPNEKTGKMELDTETRYNDKGQRVSERTRVEWAKNSDKITEYEPETQKPIREVRFNNKDNRARHVFEDMSENGKWTKKTFFDKKGRIESKSECDGTSGKETRIEYFDKKGRIESKSECDGTSGKDTRIEYFDKKGRTTEVIECDSEGNAKKHTCYRKDRTPESTIEYNGKEAKRTYYDKTGKKVTKVETSSDGGKTWKAGELKDASEATNLPELPKDPKLSPRDLRIAKRELRRALKKIEKSDDEAKFNTIFDDIKKKGNAEQQKELTKMVNDRKAELAKAEKKAPKAEKIGYFWRTKTNADGSYVRTRKTLSGNIIEQTYHSNNIPKFIVVKDTEGTMIKTVGFYKDGAPYMVTEYNSTGTMPIKETRFRQDGKTVMAIEKYDPKVKNKVISKTEFDSDGKVIGVSTSEQGVLYDKVTDKAKAAKLAAKIEEAGTTGRIKRQKAPKLEKKTTNKPATEGEKPAGNEPKVRKGLIWDRTTDDQGNKVLTRNSRRHGKITRVKKDGKLLSRTYEKDWVSVTEAYENGKLSSKKTVTQKPNEPSKVVYELYLKEGNNKITKTSNYTLTDEGVQLFEGGVDEIRSSKGKLLQKIFYDKYARKSIVDYGENEVPVKRTEIHSDCTIECENYDPQIKDFTKRTVKNNDGTTYIDEYKNGSWEPAPKSNPEPVAENPFKPAVEEEPIELPNIFEEIPAEPKPEPVVETSAPASSSIPKLNLSELPPERCGLFRTKADMFDVEMLSSTEAEIRVDSKFNNDRVLGELFASPHEGVIFKPVENGLTKYNVKEPAVIELIDGVWTLVQDMLIEVAR